MPTTFPMPIPTLTRVHTLNELEGDNVITDFDAFLEAHVSLVILGKFEEEAVILSDANKICTQNTTHHKLRVLWLDKVEQLVALKPKIQAALDAAYPEKAITFENVRAVTMTPTINYVIFVNPALSPDPKDKRKRISFFQMQRAFNAATKALTPPPSTT